MRRIMADKLPLIVIFVSAGCAVGFAVFMLYKRRREYFYELNAFVGKYLSSVMYSKDTVVKVIQGFETSSKLLSKHLGEFVDGKKNSSAPQFSPSYLKKAEIAYVKSLFALLGTSDAGTQKSSVGGKREELLSFLAAAEEKLNKNGGSSIKLGFFGGLLISILCL